MVSPSNEIPMTMLQYSPHACTVAPCCFLRPKETKAYLHRGGWVIIWNLSCKKNLKYHLCFSCEYDVCAYCYLEGHCFCWSVRGTYITPMSCFCVIRPCISLSICNKSWWPPSGPYGMIKRPPNANCSINWEMNSKYIDKIIVHSAISALGGNTAWMILMCLMLRQAHAKL